tara:strand:- start:12399 stop:13085 length:687 start_codon:yes stop_codon:yes gene_type:complete
MQSKDIFLAAVITVRKGSQRVKNKNFKKFYKKNLLEYKIEILKKVKNIKKIIINTDSDKAINIAKKLKVDYHKRSKFFASSSCKNSDFWRHIAENTKSKYILFTHCTNPFIKIKTYEKLINIFMKKKNRHDSFNTVSDVKEFLYIKNKPLNFNPSKAPNSQNLPDVFKLNFAINILQTDLMFKKKSLVGNKPFFYKLDQFEGFDINTPVDFDFASKSFEKLQKKYFNG